MMAKKDRIVIPAKKIKANSQGVIKVTDEAMECLVEVVNETGLPMRQVASIIIKQAIEKNLIIYDTEE